MNNTKYFLFAGIIYVFMSLAGCESQETALDPKEQAINTDIYSGLTTKNKLNTYFSDNNLIPDVVYIDNKLKTNFIVATIKDGISKNDVAKYIDDNNINIVGSLSQTIVIKTNIGDLSGVAIFMKKMTDSGYFENVYQRQISRIKANAMIPSEDAGSFLNSKEVEASKKWGHVAIRMSAAWERLYGDFNGIDSTNKISIGVIEDDIGGVNTHKDLNITSIVGLTNTVNSIGDHAYHVAGIIGATANNNTGIAGVIAGNKNLRLDATNYDTENIIFHINQQLISGVRVINLSFGLDENVNMK